MLSVLGGATLAALLAPAIAAALAPPDIKPPPGAELFAAQVRDRFDENVGLDFPPYRTALTSWEVKGESYLVRVAVYDVLFGFTPRYGYASVGCWTPESSMAGGWVDDPLSIAEMEWMWASAPAFCP